MGSLQEFDIGSDVNACGSLNTCKLFFIFNERVRNELFFIWLEAETLC